MLIGRKRGPPLACDDGTTIAKEIRLEDAEENIDPTKSGARLALENAASVAGMLLLTDATVTEVEEEKEPVGAPQLD